MSTFANFYRKGLASLVTGPVLVVVGLVTGIHLLALAGLVALVWGGYRFFTARRADQ